MYLALLAALPGVAGECVPAEHVFVWRDASHAFPYLILSTSASLKHLASSWLGGSCQLPSPADGISHFMEQRAGLSLRGADRVPSWGSAG